MPFSTMNNSLRQTTPLLQSGHGSQTEKYYSVLIKGPSEHIKELKSHIKSVNKRKKLRYSSSY